MPFDPDKVDLSSLSQLTPMKDAAIGDAVRSSVDSALHVNPDKHADTLDLTNKTGLPGFVVETDVESSKRQSQLNQYDFSSIADNYPATSHYFSDVDNAIIAQDDIDFMTSMESVLNTIQAGAAGAASGTLGVSEAIFRTPEAAHRWVRGLNTAFEDVTGLSPVINPARAIESTLDFFSTGKIPGTNIQKGGMTDIAGAIDESQKILGEEFEPFKANVESSVKADEAFNNALDGDFAGVADLVTDPVAVAGFVGQAVPSLALAYLSGGSLPFIGWLESMEVASNAAEFEERTGEKISDVDFMQAQTQVAILNSALEKIVPDKLLTGEAGKSALSILTTGLKEMGTEATQAFNTNLAEKLSFDPEKSLTTGVLQGAIGGFGVGSAMSASQYAVRTYEDSLKKSQQDQSTIDQIDTVVQTSKMKVRGEAGKEAFHQFVDQADGDNNTTVFVDGAQAALYLRTKTPEEVEADPALKLLSNQVREAENLGGEVQIPVADFAAEIAGTEHFAELRDSMTLSGETVAPFRQEQAKQESESYIRNMMDEAKESASEYAEAQNIFNTVRDQLVDTGVYSPQAASTMADIVPAWVTATAKRSGKTVQQVYADAGLTIEGPQTGELDRLTGEQVLTQREVSTADLQSSFQDEGLDVRLRGEGEVVTLDKIVVPVEQREAGVGTEAMQRMMTWADANGKTIALTPSKDFGASVKRLREFYKRLGFVENKGRNKDFEISESMYRVSQQPTLDEGLLAQAPLEEVDTESEAFKTWSGDGEVVEPEDVNSHIFVAGVPTILKVFHGTTHKFSVFDAKRGNLAGQFGAINYFTSSESDATDNYAGEGPDLTSRIDQRAEQLEDDIQEVIDEEGLEAAIEQFIPGADQFIEDASDIAQVIARQELHGGEEQVMELFVRVDNPFVIGENAEWIEFVDNESIEEQAIMRVAEEHDIEPAEVEANRDEYEDQIDEARWEFQEEEGHILVDAIKEVSDRHGIEASELAGQIYDLGESAKPEDIEQLLRSSEDYAYAEDDTGEPLQSQLIAEVIEEMGFDSIILKNAEERFSTMNIMGDTTHVHIFDSGKTNIKSVENIGTFDPTDPDIFRQRQQKESVTRGYYDPANNLIRLTEAADLSTFLHEFAHFMYEMELRGNTEMMQSIHNWYKRNADDVAAEANRYLGDEFDALKQSVFHGTPHKFDKFSLDAMGTGEGAQAYGWGLYFASKRSVAEWYRDELVKPKNATVRPEAGKYRATYTDRAGQSRDMGLFNTSDEAWKAIDEQQGAIYQVNIPEDDVLLDWDKPLSEQPIVVQNAIREELKGKAEEIKQADIEKDYNYFKDSDNYTDEYAEKFKSQRESIDAFEYLEEYLESEDVSYVTTRSKGELLYREFSREKGSDKAASDALNSLGIKGLRYLDGTSRGTDGDTHNYVIWDEESVTIEAVNDEQVAAEQQEVFEQTALHVTPHEFDKFDPDMVGTGEGFLSHGWGFYFTDDKEFAETFANYVIPQHHGVKGRILKVEIPDNDVMLDWDKPLSEQSEKVKQSLKNANYDPAVYPNDTGEDVYNFFVDESNGDMKDASVTLNSHGVEGVTYGDSYVVFDSDSIRILEQFTQPDQPPTKQKGRITADDVIQFLDTRSTGDQAKDAALRRAVHEQFARGFETYLMEGKAPSIELRNAFRTFARWLARIYAQVKGKLGVNLDDEMRQVFDRLLATEEQIQAAEVRAKVEPMFTDATMAGMTEEEFAAYQKQSEKVKDIQSETLRDKLIAELTRQKERWWKEEKQDLIDVETAKLEKQRVYNARTRLKTGDIKMDHATVKEIAGEDKTDKLGRTSRVIPPALRGMTAKGQLGIHPDNAAALLGYDSGSEMINDLTTAPPIKEAAETAAEKQMKEIHGDIMTDGTIEKEADEAVQSEERGKLILRELKALAKGTNAPVIERSMIRDLAIERIGKLSFREIHPGKYRKAEVRAAQEAARMLAEGNREGAIQAKQRQVMNYYLGMAATNAKNDTMKIVDRMSRYNKKTVREAIQKAEGGYWEQIAKILNRFEFRKSASLKDVESLNTWVKARIEQDGDGLVLSNEVLNESYVTHWKNVPHAELQGINDSVKNIEHVARYANKLTRMQEEIDFNTLVAKWVESMENAVTTEFVTQRTDVAEGRKWGNWAMAQMTKIPWLTSWLDGGERVGISHQVLVQPMTEAYDAEVQLWGEVAQPIMELIEQRDKETRKRHNRKIFIPEIDDNLYGHQIISVALNTGNQSNLRKLLLGEEWANPDNDAEITFDNPKLQAVLSHMTKSDWEMVQTIWDRMELLYPQLAEVHRRTTGLVPPKVVATPVSTEFGTFKGGYYPVKYDPARDMRAALNEDRLNAETESMFTGGMSLQASVNAGATNERTGYYAPIRLSLDVVPSHFQETIHYITHHDAVREINRLIRDKRVAEVIKAKLGPEEYAQLRPWLNDIAKDGREAKSKVWWEDLLGQLRFGVTLGAMGFKASTGIIQVSGLSNAAAEVGLGNLTQALRTILGNTTTMREAWEFSVANSKVMEHRMQTMDREIKNAMKRIEGKRGLLAATQELSMKHIALIQTYMVDLPTWHAAYMKGMKEWGDEARAYQYADWAVEQVHGSGVTKDMAAIMRNQNEANRMFTMFMTFFSSLWNNQRDLKRGAKSGRYSVTTVGAKLAFLYTIPVLFEMLMRGDLGEPDDEDERLQKFLTNSAMYPVATVPFIRDVASGAIGDFGYNLSPLQQILEQGTKSIPEVVERGFTDEEITEGQAKGATKFIGAALGIPGTGQAWATGEHLYDVAVEGEDFTIHQLLFGPERD
jgi:hypothetical protein